MMDGFYPDIVIALAAMVVIALIGALIVCFPVAWFVAGRLSRRADPIKRRPD
jgi:hypothetical protein